MSGLSSVSFIQKGILPLFLVLPFLAVPLAHAATAPDLGTAASYAIFGKAGVTNTGAPTHIWGDVGADLLASITGLDDATQVDGSIIAPTPAQLQTDITTAYDYLNNTGIQGTPTALDLAGTHTVTPGVYTIGATTLNGTLTLDGAGVYIFRSSSSITTSGAARVVLINGASACNVFWQIPTAMTIGAGTQMVGTIITNTAAITLGNSATLQGRAFSTIAAVTLDTNQITQPTCTASASVSTGTEDSILVRRPLISVTKIPDPLALPGPGLVTYTYQVSNPGGYAMNTVTLTDNKCNDVRYISGDSNADALLQATETWTYRCTSFLTQDTNNEATAIGFANGLPATDIAYATVNVGTLLPPPLIHVIKKSSVLLLPFGGGKVTYTYTVSNPGVVALHYVHIIDDKCGDARYVSGDMNNDTLLDMNETWIYSCMGTLTTTTTNTVTATGNANNKTATDLAFATVVVAPRPAILPRLTLVPVLHSSAPASVPAPTPEVPLLPNTGVQPDAAGVSWQFIVYGFLGALLLVLAASKTTHLFLSRK